ncbi:4-hydroxybenzoate polyprenyltransferase [Ectothiorhodosinus mongolicus]|uniref:4-hydroxybenzoate octaprenyltransferase n=1 Tax=Ectothiorhodosinus mongolicus TaxID=233100 RepID=A0A1R3W0V9_9GAMM|nr:4-hydroxybenzoate octaprenyltransferase [Ectothiorhodosinus mongolicus]ULX57016.1 4-hydroxybenzoate octaprenyltransferase [Ectothiorhodosinus mongolicus]SIT69478.1 4-hydroxybenzoate polyprenyltransferase [Ectothiorhodosinus mongolicus]
MLQRLRQYALLVRLHRPVGILLLLWPTLWALWLAADGFPDPLVLLIFVAGVTLMRSAGCAINDFADRHVDGHVTRTRDRPLATGQIRPTEAVLVAMFLALIAFGLVLMTNALTVALSFVAVLLAATYPFMKRFHHLPQVHLGTAFAWGIPMAYTAQTGQMPDAMAWVLFVATILWATAYDTMYAMVDRPDDLRIGIKSSAILFAEHDRWVVGLLQLAVLGLLSLVGWQLGLGGFYFAGLGIALLLAAYQQWLIKDREPALCFRAFLNNNSFGAVIWLAIVLEVM